MKCPVDGTTLVITDRSGVEIDYCPQCRGVWLDRGELDKIIDRSAAMAPPPPPSMQSYGQPSHPQGQPSHAHGQQPHRKKRGGFLDELCDF